MVGAGGLQKEYYPMLTTLIDRPFVDKDWIFETKWDGFRMIAVLKDGNVDLYSRNGKLVSGKYTIIATALQRIAHDAVLDGELVALDDQGVSRFQLLQNALRSKTNLRYYVFDILRLDGNDIRHLPLIKRKELLKEMLLQDRFIAYSEHRWEHGTKYFNEAKKAREEGIMAKRAESKYYSGARTREWLKIKTGSRQEVVIVGYTKPRKSRKYFGALLLAVRDAGAWRYIGRVGTGFTESLLKEIYTKLQPLRTDKRPFWTKVPDESSTTWVRPELVGEVKFTEWTSDGEMRHPAFIGLRDDKRPTEVVREQGKF
jgi:bifunctional non-homologous end joining protein LigD